MRAFFQRIDKAIFGWGSPSALGIFRILFGIAHLANWLMMASQFSYWYTEKGLVPKVTADRFNGDTWRFNPLMSLPDNLTHFWYWWMILCALLVTIGLYTRIASIMLALLTVAFHVRNPVVLHGGDTVLRNMTMLMALAPVGAAFSVDAYLRRKRGLPAIESVSLWPQRIMVFQLALVYVTTAYQKSLGELWRNGTATWYPPQLEEFVRFPVPAFLDTQPFLAITTYGTLLVEVALGTLVFWKPARRYVVLAGIGLHAAIEYRFNIPLFAFVICSCYVLYYSGEEWNAFVERWTQRVRENREKPTADVPI